MKNLHMLKQCNYYDIIKNELYINLISLYIKEQYNSEITLITSADKNSIQIIEKDRCKDIYYSSWYRIKFDKESLFIRDVSRNKIENIIKSEDGSYLISIK